ncbi:type II secretion system F family protein [uncultured Rhodospira sp.]|uniref:type II secretion system F family protein n=1 Tax=uncultured Rhodospira sp. TaxID=1936189 RepID=UPI00260CBC44|nr:type II secretion system F family protein [uncultured Rhodospira sp.]
MTETALPPDLVLIVGLAAALFVMTAALVGGLAYALTEPRRRLRRRMEGLGLQKAGGGALGGGLARGRAAGGGAESQVRQKRIQDKLRELERDKVTRARRRNRLKQALTRAGLAVSPGAYHVTTIALGLLAALASFVGGLSPLVAGLFGVIVAFGLPRLVLGFLVKRRQKKFTNEFPNAIDVLVRGVQSGLPVSECIVIVGREVPDPVGAEFRLMTEGQRVGLTLSEIMARGLERMPTPEYKFFSIVLQIQQQTGGNLAETLANLSNVIRERKQMRNKIKAMSSEAKASALIIGSLPFVVGILVNLTSPGYMMPMIDTVVGNVLLVAGGVWMLAGIGIMAKMVNFKI